MPRTWLITGTSSGLGRQLTEQLLARGDRVDDEGRITEELVRADNQSVLEQLQASASPEQSS
jgi:NAD(P)-dependent dehydrogenase (short-subunit alcohol dehydrogenase family)